MKQETTRINLNLNSQILERVDKDAQEMGITRTALISIMIKNYYDGRDVFSTLKQFVELQKEV